MALALDSRTPFQKLYRFDAGAPWERLRRTAAEFFESVGVPGTKNEEWRFTSLREFAEHEFAPAQPRDWDGRFGSADPIVVQDALRLVVVDGVFRPDASSPDIPAGLTVGSWSQTKDDPAWRRFGSTVQVDRHPFAALNTACFSEPILVHAAPGATIERPIHLAFVSQRSDAASAVFPRVLVVVGENAEVKILETHSGDGTYFTAPVTEVFVDQNGRLEHTKVQQDSLDAFHIGHVRATQEAGSVYASNAVSFGARLSRNDIDIWLGGEHTETWLNGAYMAFGEQLTDNHTRLDHAMPNCHSFQVYKGILGGAGAGVFNGKIYVHPDAQKTDAKQTNKALLLSPQATINTKPQLEIFADDVKCTHGATVGQLEADSLFYLRSRGIGLAEAQAILTYAFLAEVLEKISLEEVRTALERVVFRQVAKVEPMPEE